MSLPRGAARRRRGNTSAVSLVVSGAGPAGLMAAIAALRSGLKPDDVLLVEKRSSHSTTHPRSHGSRQRVVVIDQNATNLLADSQVELPGAGLAEMVVRLPDGSLRFFPNEGAWQTGVSAVAGGRKLARMTTLGGLEKSLLNAYRSLSGRAIFGERAYLVRGDRGATRVRIGSRELEAGLIVVAEGANSAAVLAERRAIPGTWASHFLCLDFPHYSSPVIRPGDLVSAFEPRWGTLVYGFASDTSLSMNMLLPRGCESQSLARRHLPRLRELAAELGVTEPPFKRQGSFYSGAITIANRARLAGDLILIGDALRSPDAIAGAGVNAAIADGRAVGSFFETGSAAALTTLLDQLDENSRQSIEHSLFIRELADYLLAHPVLGTASFRAGLSHRASAGFFTDRLKDIGVSLVGAALGPRGHALAVQWGFRLLGGPVPPFRSPERHQMIGEFHARQRPGRTGRRLSHRLPP